MESEGHMKLHSYVYDALDRLVIYRNALTTFERFYCGHSLACEIQGGSGYSFVQASGMLLAQCCASSVRERVSFLCVDQQNTTQIIFSNLEISHRSYTPFGYHFRQVEPIAPLGFIGEYRDLVTGYYILGHGYRAYSPVLMRFVSPDSLSPFREGGLNAYAYCKGDPLNFQDNNGHFGLPSLVRALAHGVIPVRTSSALSVAVDRVFRTARNGSPVAPANHKLIGFHGSKSKHIANLETNGLDPKYIGRNLKLDYGRGFYVSPKLSVARGYAKPSQRVNGVGVKNPNSVGAVFVKDFDTKIEGRDFDYISQHGMEQLQIVLRPHIYKDVVVLPLNSFKGVKKPELLAPHIRGR